MSNLKSLRNKLDMTQKEFAEKFNIPLRTIQKWERGGSVPPEYILESLEKIVFLEESEVMFDVYWKNEKTARVRALGQDVYIERFCLHPVKQIFYADRISRYKLGEILRDRCWSEQRNDLPVLLANLGLTEFNPYEICRVTHGKMYQDNIWFRYPGEMITYDEVKRNIY